MKATARKTTILLVEDDADIRALQQDLLDQAGYAVRSTGSGQDALALLEHNQIDLVVLDIRLPDMDGIAVCRQLRAGRHDATPVLMLSANRAHESIALALAAGADAYLTKPFSPRALLEQLTLLLRP